MSRVLILAATAFVLTTAAFAQTPSTEPQGEPQPTTPAAESPATEQTPTAEAQQIDELRRRIEILAQEVERLRSGEETAVEITDQRQRALGLAPSAAATYRRRTEGVSFAGYGEMLLENFASESESGVRSPSTTRFDFLRAILYAGYRFNDKFVFNSEIEIEHAREIFVEFAYVDYLVNDNLTLRGGLLLLPLGLVNEFHEPTVFIGARRPETEQRILPSTWRENGGGVLGTIGPFNFRAYVVNGLSAVVSGAPGFTSAGLRGGRQRGIQALAANMAFAGRLDVTPLPGVFGGVGFYQGGSGQDAVVMPSDERLDVGTTIAEVHGQAQMRGFDVRALFARASIEDAGDASRALRLRTDAPIAERLEGGYVQVGYNVLSQLTTQVSLMPYFRFEHVDTQDRVPAGFTRDLSRDGEFRTLGIELKPIPNVVIKTDYQWVTNAAGTGRNQFNVNLGYAF